MKTKHIITLLVGITFVALSPATWAAGHGGGGGGGFHGGGFGGGGFHGGDWRGFRGGALLPDTSEAESAAAAVESALADRASQVAFRTLPAEGPGSLHLVIHHSDSLL